MAAVDSKDIDVSELELQSLTACNAESFQILEVLGSGQCGIVFKVKCTRAHHPAPPGRVYALKIVFNFGVSYSSVHNAFKDEFLILSSLPRHPNVMRYLGQFMQRLPEDWLQYLPSAAKDAARELDAYQRPTNRLIKMQFVMFEYYPQTLLSALQTSHAALPTSQLLKWCHDITTALLHLQANHVLHRDLKLDNVLVAADGRAVICDFGLAIRMDPTEGFKRRLAPGTAVGGNQAHLSPELLSASRAHATGRTPEVDFSGQYAFELGAIIHEILCGMHPVEDYPNCDYVGDQMHYDASKIQDLPDRFHPDLRKVVKSLVACDPARRPSIGTVLPLLEGPACASCVMLKARLTAAEVELDRTKHQLHDTEVTMNDFMQQVISANQVSNSLQDRVRQLEAEARSRPAVDTGRLSELTGALTREEAKVAASVLATRQLKDQIASYAIHGLFTTTSGTCDTPGTDMFSARAGFPSIVGKGFRLTDGKWYYEARVLKGGLAQIGWVRSTFTGWAGRGAGVGDDDDSWAADGSRSAGWHAGNIPYGSAWSAGDTLGCALDLNSGTISFSLNGRWTAPWGAVPGWTVRATAGTCIHPGFSMSQGQDVQIIIAEAAWRFRPPTNEYQSLGPTADVPAAVKTLAEKAVAAPPSISDTSGGNTMIAGVHFSSDAVIHVELSDRNCTVSHRGREPALAMLNQELDDGATIAFTFKLIADDMNDESVCFGVFKVPVEIGIPYAKNPNMYVWRAFNGHFHSGGAKPTAAGPKVHPGDLATFIVSRRTNTMLVQVNGGRAFRAITNLPSHGTLYPGVYMYDTAVVQFVEARTWSGPVAEPDPVTETDSTELDSKLQEMLIEALIDRQLSAVASSELAKQALHATLRSAYACGVPALYQSVDAATFSVQDMNKVAAICKEATCSVLDCDVSTGRFLVTWQLVTDRLNDETSCVGATTLPLQGRGKFNASTSTRVLRAYNGETFAAGKVQTGRTGPKLHASNYVTVLFDSERKVMQYWHDGRNVGDLFTNVTDAPLYPCMSTYNSSTTTVEFRLVSVLNLGRGGSPSIERTLQYNSARFEIASTTAQAQTDPHGQYLQMSGRGTHLLSRCLEAGRRYAVSFQLLKDSDTDQVVCFGLSRRPADGLDYDDTRTGIFLRCFNGEVRRFGVVIGSVDEVKPGSVVTLICDMVERKMHIVLNDSKADISVSDVPTDMYPAVQSYQRSERACQVRFLGIVVM